MVVERYLKNVVFAHIQGWLYKWTNYIKGYQKRWFVLSNGLLFYYRSQAEMSHTCRLYFCTKFKLYFP